MIPLIRTTVIVSIGWAACMIAPGAIATKCTRDQIDRMAHAGLSKNEIMQLCELEAEPGVSMSNGRVENLPIQWSESIKDKNTQEELATFRMQGCKRVRNLLGDFELTCDFITTSVGDDRWFHLIGGYLNSSISLYPSIARGACKETRAVDSLGYEYSASNATMAEQHADLSKKSLIKQLISGVPVKTSVTFSDVQHKAKKVALLEICVVIGEGVLADKVQFRAIPISDEKLKEHRPGGTSNNNVSPTSHPEPKNEYGMPKTKQGIPGISYGYPSDAAPYGGGLGLPDSFYEIERERIKRIFK
jgi:hypothetical protein